jgi:hypothetical protein
MKSKLLNIKLACWFLAILITLQSCVAYKITSIPISEAAKTNEKVLVTTTANSKLKLTKIEKKDSIYYGVKTVRGNETRIALKETEIKSIQPYDKAKSKAANWAIALIPVLIAIIVLATRDYAPDFGDSSPKN